jgi:hypothetical protein
LEALHHELLSHQCLLFFAVEEERERKDGEKEKQILLE